MRSPLAIVCVLLLLLTPVAWAQTSGNDNASTLADNQPAVNVRGGAVQERAPGRWIDFAPRSAHGARDARLAAQRTGETYTLAPEPAAAGTSSSSGNLLSNLLGGLSPDLLGSLLNTGLGGSTGSSGGEFSNLPPEVIQMLAGAGISLSDLNQKSNNDSSTTVEQPKDSLRTQSTSGTTEERDFVVRWAEAMLSTVFTSLAVAVQTTDFIDLIKDIFRPLFNLPSPDATDGTTPSSRLNTLRGVYAVGGGAGSGICHLLC